MTAFLVLTLFPSLVILAGVNDLFTMRIPNWISLALFAGFVVMAPMVGLGLEEGAMHLLTGGLVLAAGFLLFLVPEPRTRGRSLPRWEAAGDGAAFDPAEQPMPETGAQARPSAAPQAQRPLPLRGLGLPRVAPAPRIPVEAADGIHFIDVAEVRSIRADAHYTQVHDGSRERMCAWSISQAETQLDPAIFLRVHRSHIIATPHVTLMRKEGDGAVVELDGPAPHMVPVSRARIAELRARLGLLPRHHVSYPPEGQSA